MAEKSSDGIKGYKGPACGWAALRAVAEAVCGQMGASANAVTWEATPKRVDPAFFAEHSVSKLWKWSDYALEDQGRLTQPPRYDGKTDHFVPVSWEEALNCAGTALRNPADPTEAEFYTSGRTSNEAAFFYQLFAREFGSNIFPDCSNMCHGSTSVGLPRSIGVGKASVTLADCDKVITNQGEPHGAG